MSFETKQIANFLGSGIILPLTLVNGKPNLESGFPLIRASIINILCWDYGKRFFLAEYGSKMNQLLEEPNDDQLAEIINVFIIDAISKWEPRIEYIDSIIDRKDFQTIHLTLSYKIIATQKSDTFTFPF
jgi:phage baseplate assembly protein W